MTTKLLPILLVLASGTALAQTGATAAKPASPATPAAPAAAAAGPQAASPERMFTEWDTDKNRQLSLEEFKAGIETARATEMLMRLEQQFRKADKDNSQYIEAAEYAALPMVQRSGGGAPPFATFDANKDQKIDFKEYLGLFQAMMKRAAGAR